MVTSAVKQVLDAFEQLPDSERQTAAALILRRSLDQPLPTLDDDALCALADELFQQLDAEEQASAGSATK